MAFLAKRGHLETKRDTLSCIYFPFGLQNSQVGIKVSEQSTVQCISVKKLLLNPSSTPIIINYSMKYG